MLRDTDAVATLAVKDLGAAARFYEETLVPWKRDALHKSRSAAPGSPGATTENIGHI
jgi:hypothetical protein